jgi:hypothetical protein
MRMVVGLGAVVVFLFLAFQALFGGGSVSWNQRLTLVIGTPQGEVRGSAVTRVEERTSKDLLAPGTAMRRTFTGEAVAVEVLPGRWLFALLQGEGATGADGWAYKAYDLGAVVGSDGYRSHSLSIGKLLAQPLDVPVPLPADGLPMLVTFDDITKPDTVRRVDPADLAAVFGEGVRLKAVTLEITEEAVTEGRVEGVLGANFFRDWEKMRKDALAKAKRLNDPYFSSLQGTLARNNFIQEQAR